MEKKSIRKKKKNLKRKTHKIRNILKEKNLKGKKLVVGLLGVALLCAIHGITVKNILFEDCDDANTLRAFNPTQAFLHLKKILLLTYYGVRANMLTIILIRNSYFLIYFKNKYIEIIYFLFFKIYFLYHHIKIIQKYQKKY